nr:hypothetical protein [Microbispora sp. H13382]
MDLRGRGRSAFPFARKLRAVASRARDSETVVLVNAAEGEPASLKDKTLLTRAPHLVLEGALLTASALGSRNVLIAVGAGELAEASVTAAVAERGLTDRSSPWVAGIQERFVSGEGGALVRAVNREARLPPGRKVRSSDSGVRGLPTLLSNTETFAQLAVLAEGRRAGRGHHRGPRRGHLPARRDRAGGGPPRRTVGRAVRAVPPRPAGARAGVPANAGRRPDGPDLVRLAAAAVKGRGASRCSWTPACPPGCPARRRRPWRCAPHSPCG